MTRLWGALLWSVFLLLSLFLHGREEKRRLSEYQGLCHLLLHVKGALARAPEPLSVIFADFSDEALARASFLSLLREKGLSYALKSGVLHLEKADLQLFERYAASLGKRLYVEEKAAVDNTLLKAEEILSKKEAAYPKNRRLSGTLFFTGGMLVLLLLL